MNSIREESNELRTRMDEQLESIQKTYGNRIRIFEGMPNTIEQYYFEVSEAVHRNWEAEIHAEVVRKLKNGVSVEEIVRGASYDKAMKHMQTWYFISTVMSFVFKIDGARNWVKGKQSSNSHHTILYSMGELVLVWCGLQAQTIPSILLCRKQPFIVTYFTPCYIHCAKGDEADKCEWNKSIERAW